MLVGLQQLRQLARSTSLQQMQQSAGTGLRVFCVAGSAALSSAT
jgi:hypothetical protein